MRYPIPMLIGAISSVLWGGSIRTALTTANYPTPGQDSPWMSAFDVPRFNVPGATLTSAKVTLTVFSTLTVSGFNTTASEATYSFGSYPATEQDIVSDSFQICHPMKG